MSATKKLYDAIPAIRFNPAVIMRRSLTMVEEKLAGKFDLVDATNPFMMLMEGSSTLAAAACTDGESVLRKMYESMAVTDEELYLHMSDKDYLNRFATPARATFSLFLSRSDIERDAVPSPVGNYRKIVIPKHTEFTALDLAFTMQHAIEIRIHPHGGYDIVYDQSESSPIETLTSNIVDHKFSRMPVNVDGQAVDMDFVRLNLPVKQFKIASQKGQLNLATTFRKTYNFQDQFYYARVYINNGTSTWREITTTHTEQVYDPAEATAVLKVVGNQLQVQIPQIYLSNGLVTGEIRVDIYTTRGQMDMDLRSLAGAAYGYTWRDLDQSTPKQFYAPLTNMSLTLFCISSAVGGTDKLSFEALRDRVMGNAIGSPNLPITSVQGQAYMEDRGYSLVTHVDNVTNRKFLATRLLPTPVDGPVVSSAGLSIQTLSTTLETLVGLETVVDNGNRVTLLPSTVYSTRSGVTEIVPASVIDAIRALPIEQQADRINDEQYTYSPFHYVLDINQDRFETRAYYLDAPEVTDKNFIGDNDTAGMSVATGRYAIERNAAGYLLTLQVIGDAVWESLPETSVHCQLSFRPEGEIDYAHMNGTMIGYVGQDRVYQFQIDTNHDVNRDSELALTSFSMYGDNPRPHYCALKGEFYVTYAVSGAAADGVAPSVIDLTLNKTRLPVGTIALTREMLNVRLGDDLAGLWTSSRSLPSSLDYRRHVTDVPAVFAENVYERDGSGGKIWEVVDGKPQFKILHRKGDPVHDQNGDIAYAFRVGDIMIDNDGNPIIENTRRMLRQTDILTVDGLYYFTTEAASEAYRQTIASLITEWVSVDIRQASQVLLEQSHIAFYPKVTYGYVDVLVGEAKQVRLRADQRFTVTFYVRGVVYRDVDLRVNLAVAAKMAINDALQANVVTIDGLMEAVSGRVGNDVIGLTVTGLGGTPGHDAITLFDDSARLSIGKRAVAYPDGTIGVEDAVDVVFVHHSD